MVSGWFFRTDTSSPQIGRCLSLYAFHGRWLMGAGGGGRGPLQGRCGSLLALDFVDEMPEGDHRRVSNGVALGEEPRLPSSSHAGE
eukprot:8799794-Heterocapsa_arctica.AAC.1